MKTREELFEQIKNFCNVEDCSCSCEKCKDMCRRCPCLGTPQDILAIAKAGYQDKLRPTVWGVLSNLYHKNYDIYMIQLDQNSDGCCMFEDGKCKLHDLGLKPTEGRLSVHGWIPLLEKSSTFAVAKEWCNSENEEAIKELVLLMDK